MATLQQTTAKQIILFHGIPVMKIVNHFPHVVHDDAVYEHDDEHDDDNVNFVNLDDKVLRHNIIFHTKTEEMKRKCQQHKTSTPTLQKYFIPEFLANFLKKLSNSICPHTRTQLNLSHGLQQKSVS